MAPKTSQAGRSVREEQWKHLFRKEVSRFLQDSSQPNTRVEFVDLFLQKLKVSPFLHHAPRCEDVQNEFMDALQKELEQVACDL